MPEASSLDPNLPNLPAVSPDGRSVAFGRPSVTDNMSPLSIRSLVSGETRALPGTEGAVLPFWSPDGSSVAFFSPTAGRVARIDLASGTVRTIYVIPPRPAGGTWNRDGTILFATRGGTAEMHSVPAAGGEATVLVRHDLKRRELSLAWPQFLADGRHFLFSVRSAQAENTGIFVASLDSPNERRRILPASTRAFATSRHLLFSREGTLLAQPFDPEGLRLTHEATPVAQSLAVWQVVPNWAWFSASSSGTLAYVGESGNEEFQLVWLDRRGAKLGAIGQPALYGQLALSPDERQVAVEIADPKGHTDLWILDVARGVSSRVTTDPAGEGDPVWSPDGRALVFGSDRGHATNLFRKSLQGSDPETLLFESVNHKYPEGWSPDGKTLLYLSEDQVAPRIVKSVWALPSGPGAKPKLVLQNGFNIDEPQVSPDGRWLAYESDESGQSEVYVQPFRRMGARVRVSVDRGVQPRWRRDGRELFYLSMDRRVMSVAIQRDAPSLEVGLPTALFESTSIHPGYDDYAPSADGQRFLVKVPLQSRNMRLHVVLNWPALLPTTEGSR